MRPRCVPTWSCVGVPSSSQVPSPCSVRCRKLGRSEPSTRDAGHPVTVTGISTGVYAATVAGVSRCTTGGPRISSVTVNPVDRVSSSGLCATKGSTRRSPTVEVPRSTRPSNVNPSGRSSPSLICGVGVPCTPASSTRSTTVSPPWTVPDAVTDVRSTVGAAGSSSTAAAGPAGTIRPRAVTATAARAATLRRGSRGDTTLCIGGPRWSGARLSSAGKRTQRSPFRGAADRGEHRCG